MSSWIKVGNPKLKGNRVENKLTVSKDLKKFFRYLVFYAEYDEQIRYNPSILNIPVISSLIAFAWLAGAELRVRDLDKVFSLSMEKLYKEYKLMYPRVLGGKLVVERVWENKISATGLALFFSGGLDSTYSLYQLREKSPRLIMVGGFDAYMHRPRDEPIWKKLKQIYGKFAEREGLKINFIRTNSRACMKEDDIDSTYHNKLKLSFWDAIRHAVLLIGLAAPLSMERFNELIISASRTPEHPTTMLPYSSAPNTDEKVAWANLKVTHYGQLHRYEKVRRLLEPLREKKITFKTCYKLRLDLNCSECEKCGRIVTFLLAEGIDPNTCGFKVDNDTLKKIRTYLKQFIKKDYRMQIHWLPWLNDLPDEVPDLYGIKEFIELMKNDQNINGGGSTDR